MDPNTGRPAYTNGWKRLRQSVIDESTHCGICGDSVDKTLIGTHKLGPTVDHITPLILGGDPFARSNLRLAHFGCNSKAGAMVVLQAERERVAVLRLALAMAHAGL